MADRRDWGRGGRGEGSPSALVNDCADVNSAYWGGGGGCRTKRRSEDGVEAGVLRGNDEQAAAGHARGKGDTVQRERERERERELPYVKTFEFVRRGVRSFLQCSFPTDNGSEGVLIMSNNILMGFRPDLPFRKNASEKQTSVGKRSPPLHDLKAICGNPLSIALYKDICPTLIPNKLVP